MPKTTALGLAHDISFMFGTGNLARRSKAHPQSYNQSEMPVPLITDSFYLRHFNTTIQIADYAISGTDSIIILDHELPRGNYSMMVEDEVHIGVFLDKIIGNWDNNLVNTATNKGGNYHSTQGHIRILFEARDAAGLSTTLQHLGNI